MHAFVDRDPMSGRTPVERFRFEAPTTDDFRTAVARAGVDEAAWRRLCAAARVPADGPHTVHQLDLLAEVVKTEPGTLGVIGRSLAVRVTTFHTLSSLNGVLR
jgi:hypothetical protein